MTPLMWSSNKTSSIDPTRLLITLGASFTMQDNVKVSHIYTLDEFTKIFLSVTPLLGDSLKTNMPNQRPIGD